VRNTQREGGNAKEEKKDKQSNKNNKQKPPRFEDNPLKMGLYTKKNGKTGMICCYFL